MSTDDGVRLEKDVDPPTPADADSEPTAGPADGPVDQAPDEAPDEPTDGAVGASDDAPRFWHREHPVFTPLVGFFTGLVAILIALAALGWILDKTVGYDISEHPWVFLVAVGVVLVVNLVLVALPRSRRFARYMLFGVLLTPLVIIVSAALTTYLLLKSDR